MVLLDVVPSRDRDGKYPPVFDALLADAGIHVVLTGYGCPGGLDIELTADQMRWLDLRS